MKNTSKTTTKSSAAGNLYQARMGPNSNTKTPETRKLNAQTSSNCFEKKRRCYTMVNMPPSQLFWDLCVCVCVRVCVYVCIYIYIYIYIYATCPFQVWQISWFSFHWLFTHYLTGLEKCTHTHTDDTLNRGPDSLWSLKITGFPSKKSRGVTPASWPNFPIGFWHIMAS